MEDVIDELEELRKETRGADRIKETSDVEGTTKPFDGFKENYQDTLREVSTGIHPRSISIREEQITALMRTVLDDEETREQLENQIRTKLGDQELSDDLSRQEILNKSMEIGLNQLIPNHLEAIDETK